MPGVVPMLVKRGVVDLELYLVDQGLLNSLVSSKIPDVEVQKQASEVSLCFYQFQPFPIPTPSVPGKEEEMVCSCSLPPSRRAQVGKQVAVANCASLDRSDDLEGAPMPWHWSFVSE
jgi:hypothetical protein